MAKIDKDTVVCISIAKKPSRFGSTIFNSLFEKEQMNWIYKPFAVDEKSLEAAIGGIRAFGIRGCGVSMPHKIEVMKYLDEVEPTAKRIGAVNTIVNTDGKLVGYNTDYVGCFRAVSEICDASGKTALVYGAGGVARAVIMGLKRAEVSKIYVANRTDEHAQQICEELECEFVPLEKINEIDADIFYNATSVGMAPESEEMPFDEKFISKFEVIGEVVINPIETKLISTAKKLGKKVVSGYRMTVFQALEQFYLYTGKRADGKFVERKLEQLLG